MHVCYDKDGDTPGRISLVSLGPSQTYGETLTAFGHAFLYLPGKTVDIAADYVDVKTRRVARRPTMALRQNGNIIRGVPRGCRVTITFGAVTVASEIVNDGVVEFEPEHPGVYRATFNCWPYMPVTMDLSR
jgi:hypothetical protein